MDPLLLLLQSQHAGDAPLAPGVEVAIVTDNRDGSRQGRVKVYYPRLPGQPESDWIRVAAPVAGPERGFFWLPEVQDEVLVAFVGGDPGQACVIGGLWNGQDRPPPEAAESPHLIRQLRSRAGHSITLDDTPGAERITIADSSGRRSLTWDVAAARWVLEALDGGIELRAPQGTVRVECRRFEVKADEDIRLEAGARLDLESGAATRIEAGPSLRLKARRIDLN